MLRREFSLHDRTYRVYHIFARQIIGGRNFCHACGFFVTLRLHYLAAFIPQTHSRKGVDTIVDTTVTRLPAAGHSGICGVDYRLAFKRSNIAFPKINFILHRHQIGDIRNSPAFSKFREKFILGFQKILIRFHGRTDIHKASVKPKFIVFIFGNFDSADIVSFRKKIVC